VASATGRTQYAGPPTTRKPSPDAAPTTPLTTRHLSIRQDSPGIGSDAAIIEAIAQIGLSLPPLSWARSSSIFA